MKKKSMLVLVVMSILFISLQVSVFASEPITWDSVASKGAILSNGNLTAEIPGLTNKIAVASNSKQSGKWYWEVTLDSGNGPNIGIMEGNIFTYEKKIRQYNPVTGFLVKDGANTGVIVSKAKQGDVIGVSLDVDNGTLEFYLNGISLGSKFTDVKEMTKGIYPWINGGSSKCTTTVNFGATPFKYPVPEGFLPYDSEVQENTNLTLSVLLEVDEIVQLSVTSDLSENGKLMWSSVDETVATVDTDGKVTAVKEGTTQIYAENADETFREYINIKVVAKGEAEELRLALDLNVGKSQRLYLNDDIENITWVSLDETIATVDATGKVKAVSEGLVIINATYNDENYMIYVRVA